MILVLVYFYGRLDMWGFWNCAMVYWIMRGTFIHNLIFLYLYQILEGINPQIILISILSHKFQGEVVIDWTQTPYILLSNVVYFIDFHSRGNFYLSWLLILVLIYVNDIFLQNDTPIFPTLGLIWPNVQESRQIVILLILSSFWNCTSCCRFQNHRNLVSFWHLRIYRFWTFKYNLTQTWKYMARLWVNSAARYISRRL